MRGYTYYDLHLLTEDTHSNFTLLTEDHTLCLTPANWGHTHTLPTNRGHTRALYQQIEDIKF
jgi:DNA polymerase III psi subunit